MDNRLDDDLRALRAEERPAAFDEIEQHVWRKIESVRHARRAAPMLYAVRAAAVVGALGIGVAGGGAAAIAVAREPQETSAFSVRTELAPSTLLDHHG